jgi:hypothetical protein
MTYSIKTNVGTWLIAPGAAESWVLMLRLGGSESWDIVSVHGLPERAASYVARSDTGKIVWDLQMHNAEDFDLSKWDQDPNDRRPL